MIKILFKIVVYVIVFVGVLIMFVFFYFMFVFVIQLCIDIFNVLLLLWFSDELFNNIQVFMIWLLFWKNVGWSFYVGLMFMVLMLLFCFMVGYVFVMLEFCFKKVLFVLVMGMLMVLVFMNMIFSFMVMDVFGWIDICCVLYLFGVVSVFGIFLMCQFVVSIVFKELFSVVCIDGVSEFGIYWCIVLLLMKLVFGMFGFIIFISLWNNFMNLLIVMCMVENYMLFLVLCSFFSIISIEWGVLMVGLVIVILFLFVFFVILLCQFIVGLMVGVVK